MSVAHERHGRFVFNIDKRLAAHVDNYLLDRAARELPRALAGIVLRHRIGAIASDAQALAIQ